MATREMNNVEACTGTVHGGMGVIGERPYVEEDTCDGTPECPPLTKAFMRMAETQGPLPMTVFACAEALTPTPGHGTTIDAIDAALGNAAESAEQISKDLETSSMELETMKGLNYVVRLSKDGDSWTAEFIDCPGYPKNCNFDCDSCDQNPAPREAVSPYPPGELAALMLQAWQTSETHGWHENGGQSFGEFIALVHSELSEALETYREGSSLSYLGAEGKPEGVAVELADALIRILDYCEHREIPLLQALEAKMAYNESRPHRHGGKVL